METTEVRLFKESDQSFIYHIEERDFGVYHHHPEYELVLISQGSGIRIIGDDINLFKKNDLIFLGSHLPHVWRCDREYTDDQGNFRGQGYVVHFLKDSFGMSFFELPENRKLAKFLSEASRGCRFYGDTKKRLAESMVDMKSMNPTQRLYTLFKIFETLCTTREYEFICSPGSQEANTEISSGPMRDVVEFMLKNFKKDIKLKDVLEIANMSNTQFFLSFKKLYRMPFKTYLLKLRIGYSCRLLANHNINVSQIAYESGFENLSNFNRHFKSIKDCTPTQYRKRL